MMETVMAKRSIPVRKKPYRGILQKPLLPEDDPRYEAELTNKLIALFHHYNRKPGDWRGLALQFSFERIPGFRPSAQDLPDPPPLPEDSSATERLIRAMCLPTKRNPGRSPSPAKYRASEAAFLYGIIKEREPFRSDKEIYTEIIDHWRKEFLQEHSSGVYDKSLKRDHYDISPNTLAKAVRAYRKEKVERDG
jgi:hypothetical protein